MWYIEERCGNNRWIKLIHPRYRFDDETEAIKVCRQLNVDIKSLGHYRVVKESD